MCPNCTCFGTCKPVEDGCKQDKDCKNGEYCAYPDGKCGGLGKCAKRPQYCYLMIMPVCGCNGKTYSNACFAASAGQSIAYKGKCENTNKKCRSDKDCNEGQYCKGEDVCPDCVYGDPPCAMPCYFEGVCKDIPEDACTQNSDCAKNEICSFNAGESIGKCIKGGERKCYSNDECPDGQKCELRDCMPNPDCEDGETCVDNCYGVCVDSK